MNTFFVYLPDGLAGLKAGLPPENLSLLADRLWVVASEEATCADLCTRLGIGPSPGGIRGVVSKMDEFYGYYDRSLWDKLGVWQVQR